MYGNFSMSNTAPQNKKPKPTTMNIKVAKVCTSISLVERFLDFMVFSK